MEWVEGNTAHISVVFSWHMDSAWTRAKWLSAAGYQVRVGGPGTHVKTPAREAIKEFAEVGGHVADAVKRHNPKAVFASRGCDVGCWFCIVPAMEGDKFRLIQDFEPRPILCDNNLSGLPVEFQDYIVDRYRKAGVFIQDAQSGFEPRTFDESVFHRWQPIMRGPWRFACDDQGDMPHVERMMRTLECVKSPSRKRVYVLIGNEPYASCMDRLKRVLAWGGEPHCQFLIKLNAQRKEPWVRFDWTAQRLKDVARWANRRVWRYVDFEEYDRTARTRPPAREGQGSLFALPN